MQISLFKFIEKHPATENRLINGMSSAAGFKLTIWDFEEWNDNTYEFNLNYEETDVEATLAFVLLRNFYTLLLLVLFLTLGGLETGWTFILLSLLSISTVTKIMTAITTIYLDKPTREWHSCEHKCVRVLHEMSELNLSNLKKADPVALECGSVLVTNLLQVIISLWTTYSGYYLLSSGKNYFGIAVLLTGWLFLVSCCAFYRVTRTAYWLQNEKLVMYLSLPASILPYLVEKYLALKEPSDDKLIQAVTSLNKFVEENELYRLRDHA